MPPFALGQYGMGVNRYKKLKSLIGLYWNTDESDLETGAPDRYIKNVETDFNEHYESVYNPSSKLVADESMCPYTGAVGNPDSKNPPDYKLLFRQDFVPRKPKPLGLEIKDVACVDSGIICRIEYQRGKELHKDQEYYDEYGHTTAQSLRLTKPYHFTKRTYAADSWFMGVKAAEALLDFGVYGFGDVKTNSSRFPVKYLQEHCGQQPGDWITLTTTDEKGRLLLAIGHRRGPAVHTYVSSFGTTVMGKPQLAYEEIGDNGNVQSEPRKCPRILNLYTEAQPKIDVHNRCRQEILAIEEAFRTESFPFRFHSFILGLTFVNCYKLSVRFHSEQRPMMTYLSELFYQLMTNTLDEQLGAAGPPGSGAPGAPSPPPKNKTNNCDHVPVSLKSIGWKGSSQVKCAYCPKKVTTCCIICSTWHTVVGCCPLETKYRGEVSENACIKAHRRDPDAAHRSASKPKAQKRRRPSGA
eukprot:7391559-Prymnesium_polylepis.1